MNIYRTETNLYQVEPCQIEAGTRIIVHNRWAQRFIRACGDCGKRRNFGSLHCHNIWSQASPHRCLECQRLHAWNHDRQHHKRNSNWSMQSSCGNIQEGKSQAAPKNRRYGLFTKQNRLVMVILLSNISTFVIIPHRSLCIVCFVPLSLRRMSLTCLVYQCMLKVMPFCMATVMSLPLLYRLHICV